MLPIEKVTDDIIFYTIELQRVSNDINRNQDSQYQDLVSKLAEISSEYDASANIPEPQLKKLRNSTISKGKATIAQRFKLMSEHTDRSIARVANLEANFITGSINKAVTGSGSKKFVDKIDDYNIRKISKQILVRGATPKQWGMRQQKALENKFQDAITDSWLNKQTPAQISQRIAGTQAARFKDSIIRQQKAQNRALIETSLNAISNKVKEQTYIENIKVIKGVRHISIMDGNTTPLCSSRSGETWAYIDGNWVSIDGSHEYRIPPLHFRCRSHNAPVFVDYEDLPVSKQKLVEEENRNKIGKPTRDIKYTDPDKWLKKQPVSVQKNIMGGLYSLWKKNKVSIRDVVTQQGRYRSTSEITKLLGKEDKLIKSIPELNSLKNLRPNKIASQKYKTEVETATRAEFNSLAQSLIRKEVGNKEKDKFGRLLINTAPEDLEFGKEYHPKNLSNMLGSQEKRLAFYIHTAKKFERTKAWRKGDLSKRTTSGLNSIDRQVLKDIETKIVSDPNISTKNKEILLKIHEEASSIIGTRRSIPILESLLTLARKKDFSDIDNFLGYLNNATNNAVNTYFTRKISTETKYTANTKKDARFSSSSEAAKSVEFDYINKNTFYKDNVLLKDANEIKTKVARIGSRKLRTFTTEKSQYKSVNLEFSDDETISLFLGHLQERARMGSSSIRQWNKRLSQDTLHRKRVDYIVLRTEPGDNIVVSDKILNNQLFEQWNNGVWQGRGFSGEIKEEVGKVLVDAQIKQDLIYYLQGKVKDPELAISKYNKLPLASLKISQVVSLRKIDNLYDLDGKGRADVRDKRSKEKALALKKLEKENQKKIKQQKIEDNKSKKYTITEKITRLRLEQTKQKLTTAKIQKEAVQQHWEELSDAKYIGEISDKLDELVTYNSSPNKEFYNQARLLRAEDSKWLAKLVTNEAFSATSSGIGYTNTATKLGEKFFFQTRGIIDPDPIDSLKMGHFLYTSIVNTGLITRTKALQQTSSGIKQQTYILKTKDKEWQKATLNNKTNYGSDGLPSLKKQKPLGEDLYENSDGKLTSTPGVYSDGISVIKTPDKKFSSEQVMKGRDSRADWVSDINIESSVPIKVNNYVRNTIVELDKRGDSIIPKRVNGKNKDALKANSLRDTLDRSLLISGNLTDETFYVRYATDKYGRTYAISPFNFQGADETRSLLRFANGQKLGNGGYDHFARAFANIAGFDKITLSQRVKILDAIPEKVILDTAKNPIKYDWWRKKTNWVENGTIDLKKFSKRDVAEIKKLASEADPSSEGAFQMLALVKEKAEMILFVRNGGKLKNFVSHLPLHSDATANVLQHIAFLSRDTKLAKQVNLTKTKDVQDAYIGLRDILDDYGKNVMTTKAGKKALDDISDSTSKYGSTLPGDHPLKDFISLPEIPHALRRKSVKHALMVSQYNGGAGALSEFYFEALTTGFKKLAKTTADDVLRAEYERRYILFKNAKQSQKTAVGRILIKNINEGYPVGGQVRRDLNRIAESYEIADKIIDLKMPSGFPFRQGYKKFKISQVSLGDPATKLNKGNKGISLSVKLELDEFDHVKNKIAFTANYIHGLDAAHKAITIRILKKKYGVNSVAAIHDSIAVHAGSADKLYKAVREAALEVYKGKNLLKNLYKETERAGVKPQQFIRNNKGIRAEVKLLVDTPPDYLAHLYKKDGAKYKYIGGKKKLDNGKWYPIKDIKYEDFGNLGDYDIDELLESLYFFH